MQRLAPRTPAPERRGDRALYIHRTLFRLALAAGNTFAWIFIFTAFYAANANVAYSVAGTAILYALAQGIAALLTPLTGRSLQHSVRRTLFYGIAAIAIAYALQSFMFLPLGDRGYVFWAISMFVLFNGLHRALYWMPYRVAQTEVHARPAPAIFAREAAIALVPFFAGLVIGNEGWGAPVVLVAAGLLAILSLFPVAFLLHTQEHFSWGYAETWRQLFKGRRGRLHVNLLDGMHGAALFFVWPLGAFLVLQWSFPALGLVMSITLLLTLLLRRAFQRILNALRLDRSPAVAATLVFSAWMMRLTAGSPLQIVAVDAYYHSGVPARRFGLEPFSFDQIADGGHFVDEQTALKEMGLALGRIIMALILASLALLVAVPVAFVVAIAAAAIAAAWSAYRSHAPVRTA